MMAASSKLNMRDSCGRKELGKTPQGKARGGLPLARGKRVYSICGDRREYSVQYFSA